MREQFEQLARWSDLPWTEDVTGVAVDSDDNVFVLQRGKSPVTVLGSDGTPVAHWGDGWFSERPHQISIGPDDTVYVADDGGHSVHRFTRTGEHLGAVGDGTPSATGFDATGLEDPSQAFLKMSGGAPFNRPTKAVAASGGDIFVSDGYRNCRVHRFDSNGKLLASWGGAGTEPGRFVIPHSVGVDTRNRVFVCDRENDRVQIFDQDGALLDIWSLQRPTDVAFDARGHVYVTELALGPRDPRYGRIDTCDRELTGRVSVLTSEGNLVARLEPSRPPFVAPHALAIDSQGSVYVCEVPHSFGRSRDDHVSPRSCLRKFVRQTKLMHRPSKPASTDPIEVRK